MTDTEQTPGDAKDVDKELQQAPEICVWMSIHGGILTLKEIQDDYFNDRITKKEYTKRSNVSLIEMSKKADVLHRFSVVVPCQLIKPRRMKLDEDFVHVVFSPFFWKWYNWWSDYVRSLLPERCERLYRLATERLPAVEEYRPSGNRANYRARPAIELIPEESLPAK